MQSMKLTHTLLLSLAAVALLSCTPIDEPNKENIEDLTMEYTIRQARSAKRGISGPMQLNTDITLLAPGADAAAVHQFPFRS